MRMMWYDEETDLLRPVVVAILGDLRRDESVCVIFTVKRDVQFASYQ